MDELLAAIRKYPVHRWILWTGAGVSFPEPTSLPLGGDLTRWVLKFACGERSGERLMAIWNRARDRCLEHDPAVPFAPLPRLETILNAVAKAEQVAPDEFAILAGLGSLAAVPANANHLLLADLVLRGATVLTTNFDTGVQAAFPVLNPALRCTCSGDADRKDPYPVYRVENDPDAGYVAHVHGTAEYPPQLGATIEQVKRGLSLQARQDLEGRLAAGAVLIFLGYSVSDSFDVTPWFQSRAMGTWPASQLAFVQHGSWPVPPQVSRLAAGFGDRVIGNADTTAFLQALADRQVQPRGERFDWRRRFRAAARRPSAAGRALVTCAVCNELGINVDLVDDTAYATAEAAYVGPGLHPLRTILALAARGMGLHEEEKRHLYEAQEGPPELLFYHYTRGDARSALRHAFSIDEILEAAGTQGELEWKPYTSMSVHARRLLGRYIRHPFLRPDSPSALEEMERLEGVFRVLALREFADLQAIHQATTALRFQVLFNALRGNADREREEQILALYAEQAQVQGYVSSWRDFAIARTIRLRYEGTASGLVSEAADLLRASHDLAQVIGDRMAQRKALTTQRRLMHIARTVNAARNPGRDA